MPVLFDFTLDTHVRTKMIVFLSPLPINLQYATLEIHPPHPYSRSICVQKALPDLSVDAANAGDVLILSGLPQVDYISGLTSPMTYRCYPGPLK